MSSSYLSQPKNVFYLVIDETYAYEYYGGVEEMMNNWNTKYYQCEQDGPTHFHRRSDNLVVNPYTDEEYPDQFCKRWFVVSSALWCDVGDHAFSSLDMDMESGTRTRTKMDDRGLPVKVTVEFHACGKHSTKYASETIAIEQSKVDTAKTRGYDPDYVKWLESQVAKPIGDDE